MVHLDRTSLVRLAALAVLAAGCRVDVSFSPRNVPPVPAILSLSDLAEVDEDIPFVISGTVEDEDNAMNELSVTWFVDDVAICGPVAPEDDGSTSCEIRIGVGEHEVTLEVTDASNELGASRVRLIGIPTEAPTAEVISPVIGSPYYADIPVLLEGVARDAESAATDLVVTWFLNGAELATQTPSDASGRVRYEALLPAGDAHAIKMLVTDPSGKTGSVTVAPLRIQPPNTPPSCTLQAPADGGAIVEGETVILRGVVSDPNIDVTDLSVVWTSSLDGVLGTSTPSSTGAVVLTVPALSLGTHTLALEATDEQGASCTAPITFTVGEAPTVTVEAPTNGQQYLLDETVDVSVVVSDDRDPPGDLQVTLETNNPTPGTVLAALVPDADGRVTASFDALATGTHVLTARATDTLGLSSSQQIAILVNAAPTAPEVVIEPEEPTTTSTLMAIITTPSTDANGQVPTYRYEWRKDGVLQTTEVRSDVIGEIRRGETWSVRVYPSDGLVEGPPGFDEVVIQNTPPEVGSVTIGSGPFSEASTISCDVPSTSDADGDPVTLAYTWEVDGTPIPPTTRTLTGDWFDRGDRVRCFVTPNDGFEDGPSQASNEGLIENATPEAQGVQVYPDSPQAFEEVECRYTFVDLDGDPDQSTVTWFIDGVEAATGNPLSATLSEGDVLKCEVTPSDGLTTGRTVSALTQVAASTPTVRDVQVLPIGPRVDDTLSCTYTYEDPQGDPDRSAVVWTIDGIEVGTGSFLYPGSFAKGDQVVCTVTPSDGTYDGTPVSDFADILNSAPTTPAARILPEVPVARANDLVCQVVPGFESTDADGDTLTYRFTWRRNGLPYTGAIDAAMESTVPADDVQDDDLWACDIRATDGAAFSGRATAEVVALPGIRPNVSAGTTHSCAVLGDGTAQCWGDASEGKTTLPADQLVEIDAGAQHSCGITATDEVRCWGRDNVGQSSPPPGAYAMVTVGEIQSCALTFDNEVVCWGGGVYPPATLTARTLDLRNGHGCAVTPDDELTCWGLDDVGQASPPPGRFRQVSVGRLHGCAVSVAGAITCWGSPESGRLDAPPGLDWLRVSLGRSHSCAVHTDGTVACWGGNTDGQTDVIPGDYVDVAAGEAHTCALTRDDRVVCWGADDFGQASPP